MRQSEKDELIERLDVIDEALHSAKYWVQRDSDPNGIQEAMFRFGTASAYITRLREDIRNTKTDPDEDDYPELPPNGTMSELFVDTAGWKGGRSHRNMCPLQSLRSRKRKIRRTLFCRRKKIGR